MLSNGGPALRPDGFALVTSRRLKRTPEMKKNARPPCGAGRRAVPVRRDKAKHPLGRGALSVRFAVFPQAHTHVMSRQFFVVCRQHWHLQASDQREAAPKAPKRRTGGVEVRPTVHLPRSYAGTASKIGEIPRLTRGRPVVKKPLQRSFSTQPEHASR